MLTDNKIPVNTQMWMQARAKHIASTFAYSEADDLYQDAWVWLLSKPGRIDNMWEDGEFRHAYFYTVIGRVMTRSAKLDRVRAKGHWYEEQWKYSRKEVERLLPFLWDAALAPQEEVHVTSGGDKSKTSDLPAKLIDLETAYRAVIEFDSIEDFIIQGIFRFGYTQAEMAEKTDSGLDQPGVSKLVQASIKKIVKELNHTSWGRTWDDPTEENDGPGSRKALSNSEALSLTS